MLMRADPGRRYPRPGEQRRLSPPVKGSSNITSYRLSAGLAPFCMRTMVPRRPSGTENPSLGNSSCSNILLIYRKHNPTIPEALNFCSFLPHVQFNCFKDLPTGNSSSFGLDREIFMLKPSTAELKMFTQHCLFFKMLI